MDSNSQCNSPCLVQLTAGGAGKTPAWRKLQAALPLPPVGVTWRGRHSGHQHCGQTALSYPSALRTYPGFAPARVGLALIPILHGGQRRCLSDPSDVGGRAGMDMSDRKWEP